MIVFLLLLSIGHDDRRAVAALFRPNENVSAWLQMVKVHLPKATPIICVESQRHVSKVLDLHPDARVVLVHFKRCSSPAWPLCPGTGSAHNDGYRNMCRLWYSDIWQYFTGFDYVLRIDADIELHHVGKVITETIASPRVQGPDAPFVTEGMAHLFGAKGPASRNPYSNVMAVNLTWVRQSAVLAQWFNLVRATNCICHNRWGDLPLWGETLRAMNIPLVALPNWEYVHGSHHALIK